MSLAWAVVRHRFAGFAGTFAAVALGVAIVAGCTTLWASSRPEVPDAYAAAPVLARAPQVGTTDAGFPEFRPWTAGDADRLATALDALPGVAAAVPDHAFYAQRVVGGRPVGDPELSLQDGRSWSAAALGGHRLTTGRAPVRDGEVVLRGGVPGQRVEVLTAAGPATWTVTGGTDGPGLYVADAAAARRAPGVTVVGLVLAPGADEGDVARAAAGVADGTVLAGADRAGLELEAVSRIRWIGAQLLIAMVALGGFVAVFVVASTCALSAAQRRREIGLLRATGATPGQVRRLMYAEVLLIAIAAGAVGVALGALAAPLLAGPMIGAGLQPQGFAVTAQPAALAASFVVGVGTALAGVWAPARRASRTPPLEALRDAAVDRRAMTVPRWAGGLLCLAGGLGLTAALPRLPLMTQSTAALGAAMALLVAAALLAPVLIVPVVRLVTWPWRAGATGMLVREGTLTGVRRVASTAAPVLLTVGFAVLLSGMVATIEKAAGTAAAAELPASTVAVPDGAPGLPDRTVAALDGRSELPTRVLIGGTGHDAVGVADVDGLVLAGRTAADLGASAGTRLTLTFADGRAETLPVAAVRDGASITLPRSVVRAHDPDALTRMVLLDAPAAPRPGMAVLTTAEFVRRDIDAEAELIDLFLVVLVGLSVGYTGLAVANTLLMASAARRAEFGALRLAGAGTGQVLRVVTAEALLAVGVGAALGAAVAVVSLTGVVRAVEAELGTDVLLVLPWTILTVVTLACALVAAGAAAGPLLRHGRAAVQA